MSRSTYGPAAAGSSFHGGAENTSAYTRRIPSAYAGRSPPVINRTRMPPPPLRTRS